MQYPDPKIYCLYTSEAINEESISEPIPNRIRSFAPKRRISTEKNTLMIAVDTYLKLSETENSVLLISSPSHTGRIKILLLELQKPRQVKVIRKHSAIIIHL